MMKITNTWVLALLLGLAGCSGQESEVRNFILSELNDPDSAKFGEIEVMTNGKKDFACVEVNAKNSFGGYTGVRNIYLRKDIDSSFWDVTTDTDTGHAECLYYHKKFWKVEG